MVIEQQKKGVGGEMILGGPNAITKALKTKKMFTGFQMKLE